VGQGMNFILILGQSQTEKHILKVGDCGAIQGFSKNTLDIGAYNFKFRAYNFEFRAYN